jgi:glycosyltransferase involved in cell wall biosynthesis
VNRISCQDFPHEDMEVIFVEEGSEDNTLSEIVQIASKMDMKNKIFHQSWKGLGYSRNVVLRNGEGDYIVWVDDGTIIPKDYVRKQVEFMEEHPNLGIVQGFIGVYSGSNRVAILENMGDLAFAEKNAGKSITKLPGAGGSVYRVKAAKQVGGFSDGVQGAGEDTDIAYRILSIGWQIHITKVEYFIEYSETLRRVWKKSLWYGYGGHFMQHKHKEMRENLYKTNPLAGFLEGVITFSSAYKMSHKKIALLLPVYYFSKRIMWFIGFNKSHLDSYGHTKS